MSRLESLLVRVRVAGDTGVMSPELAAEIQAELRRRALPAERAEVRNAQLRKAADLLPGTAYQKAKGLAKVIQSLEGVRCPLPDGRGTARDLVIDALQIDPETPQSARQIFRILE